MRKVIALFTSASGKKYPFFEEGEMDKFVAMGSGKVTHPDDLFAEWSEDYKGDYGHWVFRTSHDLKGIAERAAYRASIEKAKKAYEDAFQAEVSARWAERGAKDLRDYADKYFEARKKECRGDDSLLFELDGKAYRIAVGISYDIEREVKQYLEEQGIKKP